MRELVVSRDGAAIACWRRGSGPPLVLVHGSGADHRCWDRAGSILAGSFTVLAIDRRGHGSSADATWRGLDTDVEDLGAVLAAAGSPAALLGHSYGALCCLEAVARGAAVSGLVLCEPPVSAHWPGVAEHLRERLASGDREAVVTTFYRQVVGVPAEQVRTMRALPAYTNRLAGAHTLSRELDELERYELRPERLAAVRTPTLLLLGGRSPAFLHAASRALRQALPRSRLTVLDDQRHLAMESSPALFADAVRGFLHG